MNQKLKTLISESQRLQNLFSKILALLRGTPSEHIIEQMLSSTLMIARTEA